MRIAHFQCESWCGDFPHNLKRLEEGLVRAEREQVEILTFPECSLTGYPDTEKEARWGAFSMSSPQVAQVLDVTSRFDTTVVVGLNELRGKDLYNSALVAHRGHVLGVYSKCAAYQNFHRQGREFPVFERNGVKFGVLICADGGYIEPARILAAQGARLILAPHFNYIRDTGLLSHFMKVRADHAARAIENQVYFVRGNNVVLDPSKSGITRSSGVGYGDSYIMDPGGELLVRSRRHVEDFISADLDFSKGPDLSWGQPKSAWSFREFGDILAKELEKAVTAS